MATGCDGGSAPPRALERGTFHLDVTETLEGEPTTPNITDLFITRRLLYLGFERVEDPAAADYRIEGSVVCTYYQDHQFHYYDHSVHLEHQFQAVVKCTLTEVAGKDGQEPRTEVFDFPEPLIYGREKMDDARRDIRRDAGTLLANRLCSGKLLGDPQLVGLMNSLGDGASPKTFNAVIDELVKVGKRSVPYLLEALADDRTVKLTGEYPGLDASNREKFYYYHVADAALKRILRAESGLGIDSTEDYLLNVQAGWTWKWEDMQQVPKKYRILTKKRADTVKATPHGTYQASEAVGDDE